MPIKHHHQADTELQLTDEERQELAEAENAINRGIKAFWELCLAMTKIHSKRLYRETHKTFEEYCSKRWDMKRRYAYRLCEAAKVFENVSNWTHLPPANEAQARPLTTLKDPEQQRIAWLNALKASDNQPTAKHVEQAVREIKKLIQPEENEGEPAAESVSLTDDADKGKATCGWKRMPSGGGRFYGLNLHDEETGLLIESMAQQRGKLPQTIIAEAVKELAAKDETQQRFAELEAKLAATEAEVNRLKAKEDAPGELEINPAEQLAEKLRLIVSQSGTWADIEEAIAYNETYKVEAWDLLSDEEKRAIILLKPTKSEPKSTESPAPQQPEPSPTTIPTPQQPELSHITPPTPQQSEPNQPNQSTNSLPDKFPIGARIEKTFGDGSKLVGMVTGYLDDKWVQFISDGGYSDMGRELNLRLLELPVAVSA